MGRIWPEYGQNMARIWQEYGQNKATEYGQNMNMATKYGQNVHMATEYGQNMNMTFLFKQKNGQRCNRRCAYALRICDRNFAQCPNEP